MMNRRTMLIASATSLALTIAGIDVAQAAGPGATLAVTMTNDAASNEIMVYDAASHGLVQTLPANGAGGAGGNARGVRQLDGELFAAVNNGSNSVALFRRDGRGLRFDRLVPTTSAPLSIDFGNGHMYVAGATTADSYPVNGYVVGARDGTTTLQLAEGGAPPAGATAQIGVADAETVLVTLKTDPTPGTVDVIDLNANGAIAGSLAAVAAPAASLTPFGFAVNADGAAVITLAHSNEVGLFRDGAFNAVIPSSQAADCWAAGYGKYTFTANTGSRTVSRLVGTGNNVFVDSAVAASITAGGSPSDIDAEAGLVGVISRGGGVSHVSLFAVNAFGELSAHGSPIDINVSGANGIAIMPPR
jgi:hypothetical protein